MQWHLRHGLPRRQINRIIFSHQRKAPLWIENPVKKEKKKANLDEKEIYITKEQVTLL